MSSPTPPRHWAPRLRQLRIRDLYRGESQGRLDPDLLNEVGWTLWERARDVIYVSEAMWTGVVRCPACNARAQQIRRTVGPRRPFRATSCGDCGYEGSWDAVRDALRTAPLCLRCLEPLEWAYRREELHCRRCDETTGYRLWRHRMRGRKLLPCPQCGKRLSKPPLEGAEWAEVPAKTRPGKARTEKRKNVVRCTACDWQGQWSWFKQSWQGQKLATGGGLPVCHRFRDEWERCRDPRDQMLLIDGFIHALHFGPLAPLFVEGERDSVLALLDDLAGRT